MNLGGAEQTKFPRINALDSLRGLAALTVVFNHIWQSMPISAWKEMGPLSIGTVLTPYFLFTYSPLSILVGGLPAVILFFVLSGFVLSIPANIGNPLNYKAFAVRRICRIYLPLVASVFAAALLAILINCEHVNPSIWLDYWTKHPLSWNLILKDLSLGLDEDKVLDPPSWSLIHEIRISLIFPLLVLCFLKFRSRITIFGAVALYFLVWAISRKIYYGEQGHGTETYLWSELMTVHYIPFFMVGIVLASAHVREKIKLPKWYILKAGIWILALGAMSPLW